MISIKGLAFAWPGGQPVLSGLDLSVAQGEMAAVIGPNGAGKTSLLKLVAGFLEPLQGDVMIDGEPVSRLSPLARARKMAYVFQEQTSDHGRTVLEIVLLGRHPHTRGRLFDSEEDRVIAQGALAMTGMGGFDERGFHTLSGGEKQRVILAAAIAQETGILLFDEPASATDIKYKVWIYELIRRITRSKGYTTMIVTHDLTMASLYCDRIALLHGGRIRNVGTPEQVITEDTLKTVFDTPVRVITHPECGKPMVIPVPGKDTL